MKSANEKWKQFKSKLTREYIIKRCHDSRLMNTPPPEHDITQADWSQFVISRMSEDFKVKIDETILNTMKIVSITVSIKENV